MRETGTTYRSSGYLMVAVASILFGINGVFARLLFDRGVSPLTLVEFRMAIGCVCLFAWLIIGRRVKLKLPRRSWLWVLIFGLMLAFVTYTYFMAISRLPIAIVLVIQFSAPIWMTLVEAVLRRRWPSPLVLFTLGCSLIGVVLLTGVWQQNLNGLDVLGLVYTLLALVIYIAFLLAGQRVGQEIPALLSTAYGALIAGIFWMIVQPPWQIPATSWQSDNLLLILLVGVMGMAVPFSLIQESLRRVSASRVGIVAMLELVAAGVVAYIWLGQKLDVWQIGGCVLVLIGILFLQREKLSEGSVVASQETGEK